jgi:hypothetical protein
MSGLRALPHLTRGIKCRPQLIIKQARAFSACSRCQTDGVYQELTAMRTRMPFIEALRAQQENKDASNKPSTSDKASRDLTPKSMEDSYVRVVSHLIIPLWSPAHKSPDLTTCTRPMAFGSVYQRFRSYQTRDAFHGSRCFGWCGCL